MIGGNGTHYSTSKKIEALSREIKMRRRVYPRWVVAQRMTQEKADYEIAVMEAILADYQGIQQQKELLI